MFRKLLDSLSGRTTAFCAAFFCAGNLMHALHRLDGTYIAFMGTLMGFVLGHSVKEDLVAKKADAAPADEKPTP